MKFLAFIIPIIILSISFIPLLILIKKSKRTGLNKSPKTAKKLMTLHYILIIGLTIAATVLLSFSRAVYALPSASMGAIQTIQNSSQNLTLCFKYISAALAVGISCIGAGIGIGNGISAAIGAYSENEKTFSKALMFVAFGEGIAIYGLVVSFLILFVA